MQVRVIKRALLASFIILSGTSFINYILYDHECEISFLSHDEIQIQRMAHFNLKFNTVLLIQPRFKRLALFEMTYRQVIVHVCNVKNFVAAILHWKQVTPCDN